MLTIVDEEDAVTPIACKLVSALIAAAIAALIKLKVSAAKTV